MKVVDDAIVCPRELAQALRPHLSKHPVPQSDPRTRGLLIELRGYECNHSRLRTECAALGTLFARFVGEPSAIYMLAVNETPPGLPDQFLMKPHIDRLWRPEGFGRTPPRRTTVIFLDFPAEGRGGELVIFPEDAFMDSCQFNRENAMHIVTTRGGILVQPKPGRACVMAGHLPHAVLSYTALSHDVWRLAVVLAEFAEESSPTTLSDRAFGQHP